MTIGRLEGLGRCWHKPLFLMLILLFGNMPSHPMLNANQLRRFTGLRMAVGNRFHALLHGHNGQVQGMSLFLMVKPV